MYSASFSKMNPAIEMLFFHLDYQVFWQKCIHINLTDSVKPNHLRVDKLDAQLFSHQFKIHSAFPNMLTETSRDSVTWAKCSQMRIGPSNAQTWNDEAFPMERPVGTSHTHKLPTSRPPGVQDAWESMILDLR